MRILLIGSGGREHALAWKLAQSHTIEKLYIAPGNGGTHQVGINVGIKSDAFEALGKFACDNKVDFVVVGPEDPLVKGIHDFFLSAPELKKIPVIGPARKGAQLEGSKKFAKEFMVRHKVPTARYLSVTKDNFQEGTEFLKTLEPPYVLKADGLAAGKGVLILDGLLEAQNELTAMFEGKFGAAGNTVVIEEYLNGIELSVFVLTDGHGYVILPEAKDYKRIGEGDTGLNTGGMGAISPVPFANAGFMKKVEEKIVKPTIHGLQADEIPYKGFIFIGLMNINGEPYVIEYNVRLGDPETEVVIPRIKNDLAEVLLAAAENRLDKVKLEIDERTAATVIMVSGGYPGHYENGKTISGTENTNGCMLFHAGTEVQNGALLTNGGRVLAVSAFGKNKAEALGKSYENVAKINFEQVYYRKDIGFDL
jgi:phosphoribosylamine---glycine ligase